MTTEEVAEERVAPVKPGGVGAQEPLHPGHQVGSRRFHHEMEVIGHETIGMHLPSGFPTGLGQRAEEQFSIRVAPEDGLTSIPAIHHVVDRARVLDSQLAGHATELSKALPCANL